MHHTTACNKCAQLNHLVSNGRVWLLTNSAHLCRITLSTADIGRSVAPAISPRYLSSACLHPQRMPLPSSSQPSTSSIFIPANTSSHPGMSTLLQLPHSTSIASQQSSDSSSTVIASHMHFLPGMSNHTPPLSFASCGVGYPLPVGAGFPTSTGGANQASAGEMLVPVAGPSGTAVEEVPSNQSSGTAKKKGKVAAAKRADKALDASNGDCHKWTCSNHPGLSYAVPVAAQSTHRTMNCITNDVTCGALAWSYYASYKMIHCSETITQIAITCVGAKVQLMYRSTSSPTVLQVFLGICCEHLNTMTSNG